MNTYKKRLIIAILCVANIQGAEKKDALVCVGGSAESRPKSQEELDIELAKAIIKHDYKTLQEAVRQGADVNSQTACKECKYVDCDWDQREHSYCRNNMLKLAVEMKNAKAAKFILSSPEFEVDSLEFDYYEGDDLWSGDNKNNPASEIVECTREWAGINVVPEHLILRKHMPLAETIQKFREPGDYRLKYLCLKESLKILPIISKKFLPETKQGVRFRDLAMLRHHSKAVRDEILPNFGKRNVNKENKFTIDGCAKDCQLLDLVMKTFPLILPVDCEHQNDDWYSTSHPAFGNWRSFMAEQIKATHSTVSEISGQELTRADKPLLDGMTLTLVSRLLCLPQKNTLTNLKNWQKSVFSSNDAIPRQICCGQNSSYRNSLSSMLKILSACKAVSSNLDKSGKQLICQKPSFFQPCGQSQVHRFLRTELDEQNLESLANTGCGFKKLVGPICHKLRKIDPESEEFIPMALNTFSSLGALVPKPKDLCVEDFKDDPLVQAAIQNDPRIDSWEIGDLINRPAIGTKRSRSE